MDSATTLRSAQLAYDYAEPPMTRAEMVADNADALMLRARKDDLVAEQIVERLWDRDDAVEKLTPILRMALERGDAATGLAGGILTKLRHALEIAARDLADWEVES